MGSGEGIQTEGSAGTPEIGEPKTDNLTGSSMVQEPVEEDFDLSAPVLEPEEVGTPPIQPASETSTTPENENLTPRQKAEKLIEALKEKDLELAKQEHKSEDRANAREALAKRTLDKLPDTVIEIILPESTMGSFEPEKLNNSLNNFDRGYWGYKEGTRATVIMSTSERTHFTNRRDSNGREITMDKIVPASPDMIGNALSNGHDYKELAGDRWVITVNK